MTKELEQDQIGDGVDGGVLAANIIWFGRVLMSTGLSVDADQTRRFARALALMGIGRRAEVRAAGRAIFTRRREERVVYDAAFDLFWRRGVVEGAPSKALPRISQQDRPEADVQIPPDYTEGTDVTEAVTPATPLGAASREKLSTADFADLTPAEARDAATMLETLRPRLPLRPARRSRAERVGTRLATRAMMRRALASGGEAVHWRWFRRTTRPRPIVLVCDISGSMERYTRFLLRFAHALTRAGASLEVFVFSTRLTRITRELRARNPDAALREVGRKVVDWSGGTRIGASLRELNRVWVRRTVRSGAVVLVISDGWERGDPDLLAREMAALQRSCHRLIWLDPLASRPGFQPETQGLRAALPYVDDFLPCASVASLEVLAARLVGAASRRSVRPFRRHHTFSAV